MLPRISHPTQHLGAPSGGTLRFLPGKAKTLAKNRGPTYVGIESPIAQTFKTPS